MCASAHLTLPLHVPASSVSRPALSGHEEARGLPWSGVPAVRRVTPATRMCIRRCNAYLPGQGQTVCRPGHHPCAHSAVPCFRHADLHAITRVSLPCLPRRAREPSPSATVATAAARSAATALLRPSVLTIPSHGRAPPLEHRNVKFEP